MPRPSPREMFLKSKGLYTRDMTPEQLEKKKEILSSLEKQMPYFRKKYKDRAEEVMNRIAISRAKLIKGKKTLKDSYKQLLTNMINEEKNYVSIDEFMKRAVELSSLDPEELDKTIMRSHGDDFSRRDMIHHHSKMLHYSLAAGEKLPEKHTKALQDHKVDIDALLKHFYKKKKDDDK